MRAESVQYFAKMRPYAKRASAALNMPEDAILGQWDVESDSGRSEHAVRYNNHAGIKVPSQRKFYGYKRPGTPFAGYASLDAFTDDYIENMKLGFYKNVRGAGTVEATLYALGQSPWDAGHYLLNGVPGGGIMNRMGMTVGKPIPPPVVSKVCPTCGRSL